MKETLERLAQEIEEQNDRWRALSEAARAGIDSCDLADELRNAGAAWLGAEQNNFRASGPVSRRQAWVRA